MQRLSSPTETVLSKKITRNRIVLSVKDSPQKHEDGDLLLFRAQSCHLQLLRNQDSVMGLIRRQAAGLHNLESACRVAE